MLRLTDCHDEVFVESVGHERFCQTPAGNRMTYFISLITCHFQKVKIMLIIYKPEVILQATSDGLVIPGVWVKVHICRSFGCWKGKMNSY